MKIADGTKNSKKKTKKIERNNFDKMWCFVLVK